MESSRPAVTSIAEVANPYQAPRSAAAVLKYTTALHLIALSLRKALLACVLLSACSAAFGVARVAGIIASAGPKQAATDSDLLDGLVQLAHFAAYLASVYLFVGWQRRAFERVRSAVADVEFTPESAQLGWWIPVVNLWRPFRVITHLWRTSRGGSAWREVAVPVFIRAWWACWLVLSLTLDLKLFVRALNGLPVLDLVQDCAEVGAGWLLLRIVRDVTSAQRELLQRD